jgi:hypothetical protein
MMGCYILAKKSSALVKAFTFQPELVLTEEVTLKASEYLIVPATYQANRLGKFTLLVDVTSEEIPMKGVDWHMEPQLTSELE